MNTHLFYLFVDLGCILGPLIFSFLPQSKFYKNFKPLSLALIGMMLLFLPMDALFTYLNIWHFNSNYLIGINLFNLPLEEILFFICIPFACVFSFESLRYFRADKTSRIAVIVTTIIIAVNFVTLYNHPHLSYTLYANLCSAIILIYFLFRQTKQLSNLLLSWMLLLVPFVISNGILTGLDFYQSSVLNFNFLPQDYIVGYNNQENLGIRLWTIPIEDLFYGLGMFGLTTAIYLNQLRRASSTTTAR